MKAVSLILAALALAFSLPACAGPKKTAQCCASGGSCDAPDGKSTPSHHHKKK